MAFDDSGSLFMIDTGLSQLLTIDPDSGDVLNSVGLSVSLGNGAGMVFEPTTGTLYVVDGGAGGTEKLHILDPASGILTVVGPLNLPDGLSGLTYFSPAVFQDGFESTDTTRWSSTFP